MQYDKLLWLKNRQIVHQTLIDLIVPFLDENI